MASKVRVGADVKGVSITDVFSWAISTATIPKIVKIKTGNNPITIECKCEIGINFVILDNCKGTITSGQRA